MITVTIDINGRPIYTRSAVNVDTVTGGEAAECVYELDDGSRIRHVRDAGAVQLAQRMLESIVETPRLSLANRTLFALAGLDSDEQRLQQLKLLGSRICFECGRLLRPGQECKHADDHR